MDGRKKKNGRTRGGGRKWGPRGWQDVCERESEKLQAGCIEEEIREPVAGRMHEIEGFVRAREHVRVARLKSHGVRVRAKVAI